MNKDRNNIRTIQFNEIDGIKVGNHTDSQAGTGVTVFYFPQTATGAVTILGGGPASRESELANPERNLQKLNALVLAGGSSYGLEAAHGVMKFLEQQKIGYDTGAAVVPLVCQSDIYDLSYGSSDVRPDKEAGYQACKEAFLSNRPISGNIGAGTGATVGKPYGTARAQKGGMGYYAVQLGELQVGVAVVANSFGDIYYKGGKIAGMTDRNRKSFADAAAALYEMQPSNLFTGNTTIAAVFTNGDFNAIELKKIANMASAGFARAIRPVFTMADGDTIYAFSTGSQKVKSDINIAGVLAADVIEEALYDAITASRISDDEYLRHIL